jgi:drug/metabolite transporter (DMT)-like permease
MPSPHASLVDQLPLSPTARGSLLALLSTVAIASILVVSKWALKSLTPATFGIGWYSATILIASVYQGVRGRPGLWATFRAHSPLPIVALGLLNGLATVLFFSAIQQLDPTVASFFDRSETLFVVLFGIVLLGERFTRLELGGMLALFAGVLALTYAGGRVVAFGALLVFAANFLYALGLVLVKSQLHQVDSGALTGLRAVFGLPVLLLYAVVVGGWQVPALYQIVGIVVGAFLGPFLGHVLYYRALQYISLSKASLLHASQPLFVAVLALFAFGTLPDSRQWFGGLLVLAGVYLLLIGHPRPA